jgi:hypothetical protein
MGVYRTFIRNWWRENPSWPQGLEPDPTAHKTWRDRYGSEEEAIEACQEYNRTHKPGRLSRKMEYTEE